MEYPVITTGKDDLAGAESKLILKSNAIRIDRWQLNLIQVQKWSFDIWPDIWPNLTSPSQGEVRLGFLKQAQLQFSP